MSTVSNRSMLFCSALISLGVCVADTVAGPPNFERDIAPILIRRCVECHQSPIFSGGLSLTTSDGLNHGGESGLVIHQESLRESPLLERVREGEMPPPQQGQSRQLPEEEIDLLERWIAAGAPWPNDRKLDWFERTSSSRAGRDWWSLQPVRRPNVPQVKDHQATENPIDAFVIARLQENEMEPAPLADPKTLLRRLYYDLIGMPPTRRQIESFVSDDAPLAWERMIDRLLATPQYGERWARYWLDLARYADTSGYERDQEKPYAWKYRDWVANAFGTDMPFQRFIMQQLAGDEMPERDEQSLIATGFLRLGAWNDEPNDPGDYQYERLEDLVHTTSSAFLGLTVKCARCHAHKFDPIQQEDYYRMASAFWAGPIGARDRKLLGGPSVAEAGSEHVLAWTDITSSPAPLHLLKNGDRHQPLQEVQPATLSSIPSLHHDFEPPPEGAKTSNRRLHLARWIADPANPLTPRVMVNRLWQHHFGKAIVRTPNNLGFLADPPTHPELLDWLASEFTRTGGSIKAMHRLILTSRTWRQAALHPKQDDYSRRDAGNRLWWRFERRRLDAEALRDSMLSVTGELDRAVGGESFKPSLSAEALEGLSRKSAAWQASQPHLQKRRSLYMYMKRGLLPPMMTTFDLCDPASSCGMRSVTTVPTQALALMNGRFVHDRSESLARTIINHSSEPDEQVDLAWSLILSRPASKQERGIALDHLERQLERFGRPGQSWESKDADRSPRFLALASLCHVLLNSNEFIYVD